MRIFFIVFFIFLGVSQSISQNTKTIDSLLHALQKTRNDSIKVEILGKLAYASFNQSPQVAFSYAHDAQKIAHTLSNKDMLSNSYYDIGVFFHRTSEYDSAKYYYNEAAHVAYSLEMQTKIFDNTGILFRDMGLYDSALLFHNKSLKLKETLGNRDAVAISYNNIGNVYFHMRNYSQALTHYYFSLEIRKRQNNEEAIASLLNNIGDAHRNLLEYDNAIDAYTQALEILKKIGNQQSIANTYHNIGNFYFHLKIYDKAQEFYSKALEIRIQIGNKNDIAASRFNIATVHRDLGNFNEALKYYSIALELRKQTENKVAEALTLSAIAGLYKNHKLYAKAIDYYTHALTMQLEIGNKSDVATLYERLGMVYKDTLLYEQAYEFYSKANSLYAELSNNKAQARVYTYIGNLFREQLQFSKAQKQYINAYEIQEQLLDIRGMAYTRSNMAEMLEKQNHIPEAISYYETALDLAETSHEKSLIESVSFHLYELHKLQDNYSRSLHFFELHNAIKDTLAHDKNIRRIAELEFESNIKLLEQINENQELRLREEQSKIAQQQLYLIIVIIVALLILGFSALLYRQFNQKKLAYNLLSQSRKELENTYLQLESTHTMLQEKTQKLTDSINYATRIQQAILPTHKTIKEAFNSHFIFYLPRDIVSGDFYWFAEQNNYTFIAAIDCTGHGIPGAFMSMVGNTLLNQIVNELHIYEPEAILNRLDYEIIQTLKQYEEHNKQEDGMDISLVRYSKKQNEIVFAGAGQKLVVIENNEYQTYATSPFSIGGMHSIKLEQNLSFTQTKIEVHSGMRIFLCSDGFIDQFGGENDERFTSNRFYSFLHKTSTLPIAEQHTELSKVFDEWKGERAQIDDVIVIGIEF